MRNELKKRDGQRLRFSAVVDDFGTTKNYHGYDEPTILLTDIKFLEDGTEATDHLWFKVGVTIGRLNLTVGDTVEFDARVSTYVKGYVNHRQNIDDRTLDYRLSRPTKNSVVKEVKA